jgi:NAD(P)-dependent dehydrogenase (short-subunit alcohol dehydrogenase family)
MTSERRGEGTAPGLSIDLAKRRVLVVGASSGVGRAVGLLACRSGARVAFAARRRERLDAVVARAAGEAIAVPCDVQRADACRGAVDAAVAAFGGLDAFVYAAGMSPLAMLEQASQEEWRAVLDTNLIGAALVTAAALPHLRASGGRAVFVSSYSVRQSLPGVGLYRVSKVALDAMIEDWRLEHPDLDFTRVVLGNTNETEFARDWGRERTGEVTRVWVERGLFPAPTMMPLEAAAEAIVSVLAFRGYVDDIAVMPRTRDPAAEPIARGDDPQRGPG